MNRRLITIALSVAMSIAFSLQHAPHALAQKQANPKPAKQKQRTKALDEMYFHQLREGTIIEISKEGLQGNLEYSAGSKYVQNTSTACLIRTGEKSVLLANERTLVLGKFADDKHAVSIVGHKSVTELVCWGTHGEPRVGEVKDALRNRIEIYLPEDQIGKRDKKSVSDDKQKTQETLGNTGEASI